MVVSNVVNEMANDDANGAVNDEYEVVMEFLAFFQANCQMNWIIRYNGYFGVNVAKWYKQLGKLTQFGSQLVQRLIGNCMRTAHSQSVCRAEICAFTKNLYRRTGTNYFIDMDIMSKIRKRLYHRHCGECVGWAEDLDMDKQKEIPGRRNKIWI